MMKTLPSPQTRLARFAGLAVAVLFTAPAAFAGEPLVTLAQEATQATDWQAILAAKWEHMDQFWGRMHPLLVHFPIGLIIAAALIELLFTRRTPRSSQSALVALGFGFVGAALAASSGWLNADLEPQSRSAAETIYLHRWIGVSTAGLALISLVLGRLCMKREGGSTLTLYRSALLLTCIGVVYGGHLGGSLTYGEGYLMSVFDEEPQPEEPAAAPEVSDPATELPPQETPALPPAEAEAEPGEPEATNTAAPTANTTPRANDTEPPAPNGGGENGGSSALPAEVAAGGDDPLAELLEAAPAATGTSTETTVPPAATPATTSSTSAASDEEQPPEETPAPAAGGGEGGAGGEGPDFVTQVAPIFSKNCYRCHGEKKQKGRLRLDQRASVFRGEPADWIVQPGKPDESLLVQLIDLPADSLDLMPADDDPLSKDDVDTIRQWIAAGAAWPEDSETPPAEGGDDPAPAPAPGEPEGTSDESSAANTPPPEPEPPQVAEALARLEADGHHALRIAQTDPRVEVNLSLQGADAGDEQLAALEGLGTSLAWLNLGRTAVTDEGVRTLAAYPAIERLHLERTEISDASLEVIGGFSELVYLNLYATPVTDAGLTHLEGLEKLRHLYLWDSGVTADGVEALRAALPECDIVYESTELVIVDPEPEEEPALPGCCQAAADAGGACDHPCCVEATAAGEICAKCS